MHLHNGTMHMHDPHYAFDFVLNKKCNENAIYKSTRYLFNNDNENKNLPFIQTIPTCFIDNTFMSNLHLGDENWLCDFTFNMQVDIPIKVAGTWIINFVSE